MKILTWNLERLIKNKNQLILDKLNELDADILVLTETSSKISLGKKYSSIATTFLPNDFNGIIDVSYTDEENRVTIWTKYKIKNQHKTYDKYTSVCAEIETPFGLLTLYGTIIGVFGGKGDRFKNDLENQILDFNKMLDKNASCIIGDFNVMFSGYAYPSHIARDTLNNIFDKLQLINTTEKIEYFEKNVEHIVISSSIIKDKKLTIDYWNDNFELSEHIGICLTIS